MMKNKNYFFAMRVYDQRHVLNVAYTAQKNYRAKINMKNIDCNLIDKELVYFMI